MPTVIENGVKAAQRRKSFYICRGVTDRADRVRIAFRKLLSVARRAGNMPRHFRSGGVVASDMTHKTRQATVLLCVVTKAREILRRHRSKLGLVSIGQGDHARRNDQQSGAGREPASSRPMSLSFCLLKLDHLRFAAGLDNRLQM
jgi:hypothetical protein